MEITELKKDLMDKGIKFKGTGDTEVLLQLLIKEGKNCMEYRNRLFSHK